MIPTRIRIYSKVFKDTGRDDVVKWDVLPVQNGEIIKVIFESISSNWRQGIWLQTDKGIGVNGELCESVTLWADTAQEEVLCQCFTDNGLLNVYNIWDSGRGLGIESQAWSSGMLVDELPNGRHYSCNDIGFETNFNKLLFRIEKTT